MKMTAPVVTSHAKDKIFMHFMIPSKFAANPPKPTDSDLVIVKSQKAQYYVR